ncbi:MAG: hypothetical protein GXX79_08475 [Actinomycetales bacterium]|nr:hypothetical protein [Actinomycetales bacterium]
MMERKQSAARAAALALAERAARMAQREQRIAQELAGFLGARERVSAILEVAQRRCETIAARAHKQAHASQAQAEAHVVELVALIGDRQEVAEHTGLTLHQIRRALREAQEDTDAGDTRVEDVGAETPGVEGCHADEMPRGGADQVHEEDEPGHVSPTQDIGPAGNGTQEEPEADQGGPVPSWQASGPQEWAAVSTDAEPEVTCAPAVAADEDTTPAPVTVAGEVPLDVPVTPGTWSAQPMGTHDAPSPEASPDPGMSAGVDPQPCGDIAADAPSGQDAEPVSGWRGSADRSWWSSSPGSAA